MNALLNLEPQGAGITIAHSAHEYTNQTVGSEIQQTLHAFGRLQVRNAQVQVQAHITQQDKQTPIILTFTLIITA